MALAANMHGLESCRDDPLAESGVSDCPEQIGVAYACGPELPADVRKPDPLPR
jgi:hypothetical protein